jgi:hypothetical protein
MENPLRYKHTVSRLGPLLAVNQLMPVPEHDKGEEGGKCVPAMLEMRRWIRPYCNTIQYWRIADSSLATH